MLRILFWYLIRWFSRYQLLGFTWLLAVVVICFEGVAGLGLPALFWCRTIYGNAIIGATVGGFFALCCFVGFLLDHAKLGLPANAAGMQQYFNRIYWLPTVLVSVRGLWRQLSGASCGTEWAVIVGYMVGGLLIRFVVPRLDRLAKPLAARTWFSKLVHWLSRVGGNAPPADLWLHAYALLLMAILGAVYVVAALFVETFPINAAVSICVILSLIVMAYGAVRFFTPRATLLVLLFLVAWIFAANQIALKHRYDELRHTKVVSLASYAEATQNGRVTRNAQLIGDADALNAWRARIGTRCGAKPKLVVVMTSGGGIRAAVWTAAVLAELDALVLPCRFRDHMRMIAGASGGMVGAGYYVAARAGGGEPDPKLVARDSLDAIAKYLALRDLPGQFVFWRYRDRGWALEESWKQHAKPMALPFEDLRHGERKGTIPSLIYSPASLDDGRRLIVSNLQLVDLMHHGRLSTSAVQFYELYPNASISVATAARMSASFPWVTPASELPTTELRRIGDAGYVDNFGGFVAASWIEKNRRWLIENTSGVVVLQIRDTPLSRELRDVAAVPLDDDGEPQSTRATRGFSEWIAPIQGVLATRGPVMNFRSDFDLSTLTNEFPPNFLTSFELELRRGIAPLTWNLTERAAQDIIDSAPAAVAPMKRWWEGVILPPPDASPRDRSAGLSAPRAAAP